MPAAIRPETLEGIAREFLTQPLDPADLPAVAELLNAIKADMRHSTRLPLEDAEPALLYRAAEGDV